MNQLQLYSGGRDGEGLNEFGSMCARCWMSLSIHLSFGFSSEWGASLVHRAPFLPVPRDFSELSFSHHVADSSCDVSSAPFPPSTSRSAIKIKGISVVTQFANDKTYERDDTPMTGL